MSSLKQLLTYYFILIIFQEYYDANASSPETDPCLKPGSKGINMTEPQFKGLLGALHHVQEDARLLSRCIRRKTPYTFPKGKLRRVTPQPLNLKIDTEEEPKPSPSYAPSVDQTSTSTTSLGFYV